MRSVAKKKEKYQNALSSEESRLSYNTCLSLKLLFNSTTRRLESNMLTLVFGYCPKRDSSKHTLTKHFNSVFLEGARNTHRFAHRLIMNKVSYHYCPVDLLSGHVLNALHASSCLVILSA